MQPNKEDTNQKPEKKGKRARRGSPRPRPSYAELEPAIRELFERLLSPKEIAAITGLAIGTVHSNISRRVWPVVRVSDGAPRMRASDLKALIESRLVAAKARTP
jgi:hypothetical protein